jgi:hypothetical protein
MWKSRASAQAMAKLVSSSTATITFEPGAARRSNRLRMTREVAALHSPWQKSEDAMNRTSGLAVSTLHWRLAGDR